MTRYLYTGPLTGVHLPDGREIQLYPKHEVSLDPGDAYTKNLLAKKWLTPIPAPPPPAVEPVPDPKPTYRGRK